VIASGKGFEVVYCQQQAIKNLSGIRRNLPQLFSAKRLLQGYSELFKDHMIDMYTMMMPLSYSPRKTLMIIKKNFTESKDLFKSIEGDRPGYANELCRRVREI